jgi:hypothetical protein
MSGDLLHLDELLPGLSVLPVKHGSLAFAEAARKVVLEHKFQRVALDLPLAVADEFCQAVERLPEIWAATWMQEERRWILPADPCDACTTAARIAMQERIQLVFVDDESPTSLQDDPDLPDPSVVESLGAAEYAGICLPSLEKLSDDSTRIRAARMADRLRKLPAAKTLLVVRLALLPDLLRELATPSTAIPTRSLSTRFRLLSCSRSSPSTCCSRWANGLSWHRRPSGCDKIRSNKSRQVAPGRGDCWDGRVDAIWNDARLRAYRFPN